MNLSYVFSLSGRRGEAEEVIERGIALAAAAATELGA